MIILSCLFCVGLDCRGVLFKWPIRPDFIGKNVYMGFYEDLEGILWRYVKICYTILIYVTIYCNILSFTPIYPGNSRASPPAPKPRKTHANQETADTPKITLDKPHHILLLFLPFLSRFQTIFSENKQLTTSNKWANVFSRKRLKPCPLSFSWWSCYFSFSTPTTNTSKDYTMDQIPVRYTVYFFLGVGTFFAFSRLLYEYCN